MAQPLSVRQQAYQPPPGYDFYEETPRFIYSVAIPLHTATTAAPQTPLPKSPSPPTSPTWDPQSNPLELYDLPPTSADGHWSLQRLYGDVNFRMIDRKGKQVVYTPRWTGKEMALYCYRRRKWYEVQPGGVRPKTPTARSECLMMIIHGIGMGKFVRPVRHRYERSERYWTVRVVTLVPENPDIVTAEEYVVEQYRLCEIEESPQAKELNQAQARQLKEPAAGHEL